MPCNASYARFIFGKFFTSTIILYALLFAQKNFYSCKKWVLHYPHHSYPIKHKLKDCTMMKNFMMSGALSKGRRPRESPGGKCHGTPQLAAVRDLGYVMSGEMEPMPDPNPCRAKDGGDRHESVETPEIVSP
jgi:hypothetical protein